MTSAGLNQTAMTNWKEASRMYKLLTAIALLCIASVGFAVLVGFLAFCTR